MQIDLTNTNNLDFNNRFNPIAFYEIAFSNKYERIWGDTPFRFETKDLSYKHALSIFSINTSESETDRRNLLFNYCKPTMAHFDNDDSLIKLMPILPSSNIQVRRVINAICKLYENPPSRLITGKNDIQLSEIIEASNYNTLLNEIHKIAKLTTECIVRPMFIDNVLKFEVITPDNYRYKTDKYNRKLELWINRTRVIGKDLTDCFEIYTDKTYKVITSDGKTVEVETENQYGEIPYLNFNLSFDNIYSDENETLFYELMKAQLKYNKAEILEDNSVTYNAFPIIAMFNYNIEKTDKFKIAPGRVMMKDGFMEGEILPFHEQISPESQYDQINQLRQNNMKHTLKDFEMPNSLVDDKASVQSGVAMESERKGLEEYRKTDRIILKRFETQLVNLIAKIATIESNYNFSDLKDYEVVIEFVESVTPTDAKADYELNTAKFMAGVIDAKTYIMRVTNLDDVENNEQAIKYIQDNIKILEQIKGTENAGTDTNTDTGTNADTNADAGTDTNAN